MPTFVFMKSGIYSITNQINGKIYIGYATNIKNRWKHHRSELKLGTHPNAHLQSAWNKYGKDSFVFQVVEFCTEENLCRQENHWCELLKTHKTGYNIKPTDPNEPNKRQSSETIEKIRKAHLGVKSSPETIAKLRNRIGRSIVVLTEEGKLIKEFETIEDAANELKVGKGNIFSVLKHKRKSGKGYVFVYKEEYDPEKDYSVIRNFGTYLQKPVGMYSLDGELIKNFDSVKQAGEHLGKDKFGRTAISNVLGGRAKSCNNCKWKYL